MTKGCVWVFFTYIDENLMMYSDYQAKINMSTQDILRIEKRQRRIDKKRSFIGRFLLQYALSKLDISPSVISEIEWDKYHKPFIKSIYPLQFNISHSEQCVACAVALCNIGVDVEKIDRSFLIEIDELVEFFSFSEIEHLKEFSNPYMTFFKIWTLKESVLKAKGTGFRFPANKINILNNPVSISNEKYYTFQKILNGYSCSIATDFPIKNIHFERVYL